MGYFPYIFHSVCILGETAPAWGAVYGGAEDTRSGDRNLSMSYKRSLWEETLQHFVILIISPFL